MTAAACGRRAARRRARALGWLAPVCAALTACGSSAPTTGIVGEVSTDLRVPAELDEVRVTVATTDGAELYQRSFPLGAGAGRYQLPMRIGFFRQGGGEGPVRVLAEGRLGASVVVSRSATLSFLAGKVVVVPLPLLAVCSGKLCTQADQTCIESGRCETNAVDPRQLPTYHPGSNDAAVDAGSDDAAVPDGARADTPGPDVAPPPDAPPPPADAPPLDRPAGDQGRPDKGADAGVDAGAPTDGGLNGGLVGFWTFDQQGTSYPDRSGYGNTAAVPSYAMAPTWLATLDGRSGVVRFDQQGQSWLEVASSNSINTITGAFTMAAWVDLGGNKVLAEQAILTRQIGPETVFGLGLASTGAVTAFLENGVAGPTPLAGTGWSHVAVVYDGMYLQMYLNGAPSGPMYGVQGPPLGPTTRQLVLGARNDDYAGFLEQLSGGAVDDVVVYSRALSASEIAAIKAGAGPTPR